MDTYLSLAKWRSSLLLLLALFFIAGYLSPVSHAKAAATDWKTFTDPIYGFSLNYPATWMLLPEKNGSHITLLNPATQTTISPLVTTSKDTPANILKKDSAITGAKTRTVAGHNAADWFTPYVPPKTPMHDKDAAFAFAQSRTVVLPVANTKGSTNVYTFMLAQPTDATSKASAAEQADHPIFESILDTFTLPTTLAPAIQTTCSTMPGSPASGISPYCSYPCDAVCWADANWSYTYYDDSSGSYSIYCDSNGYPTYPVDYSYTQDPHCFDGNQYSSQVPGNGYFQPNFQCADFVSRALVQNHQIAGLGNGGINGQFPATQPTGSSGTYSFQWYPFTYTPYSSDNAYNLILVPTFRQYLLDSGLGVSIGTSVSQAQAADVVVLYHNGSPTHVMITTGAGYWNSTLGQWDVLVDSHNASSYHQNLSWWMSNPYNTSFEIIHMRGSGTGSVGQAILYGGTWNSFTDTYGQSASWAYTTGNSNATAWAQYPDSGEFEPCLIAVYVPSGNGTASLTFGVQMSDGSWAYQSVNENNIDGWAVLFTWGELSSTPTIINVGNNNGSPYQQMGVGQMAFLC